MKKHYQLLISSITLCMASVNLSAQNQAIGLWQTESSTQGYLHVSFKKCEDKLCGTIAAAYDLENEPSLSYEHLGKVMVWDMQSSGNSSWKGGKIWDPTSNKTYKSKMTIENNTLSVSGCVLFFCQAQNWTRVP